MSKGIDCASRLTKETAARAKAAGFEFVGRYLVPKSYSKSLLKAEAEIICGAGLRLLTVWETSANRPLSGAEGGAYDGAAAKVCARDISMPERGIIYFAVDFEPTAAEMETVAAYIIAAAKAAAPYRIGVYGPYAVIEAARSWGVCAGYWQCVAWSYGLLSEARTVYQRVWQGGVEAVAAANQIGVPVDINECADMDAAGIWEIAAEPEIGDTSSGADAPPSPQGEGMPGAYPQGTGAPRPTDENIPDWARPTVAKLAASGALQGDGDGLNLSYDLMRTLVVLDRRGTLD